MAELLEQTPKVAIVMPAYNVGAVLGKAIAALPAGVADEIIVVSDASTDDTEQVARSCGAIVVRHEANRGYGGAQKTGYKTAIKRGADIVVMVHGDNQYDPTIADEFVKKIHDDGFDVVTGTRMVLGDALRSGMPVWKFIPNRVLTHLENFVFETNLSDYHNGYRAFTTTFLKQVPLDLLSEKFDFDTDILIQASIRKMKIGEVAHASRYDDENSQMAFGKCVCYGMSILLTVSRYLLHRIGIWRRVVFNVSRD